MCECFVCQLMNLSKLKKSLERLVVMRKAAFTRTFWSSESYEFDPHYHSPSSVFSSSGIASVSLTVFRRKCALAFTFPLFVESCDTRIPSKCVASSKRCGIGIFIEITQSHTVQLKSSMILDGLI